MTEEEAQAWIRDRFGPTVLGRMHEFAAMVVAENERQNLISPASIGTIWSRHLVDSLQLVEWAPATGTWLDIGTGGGFPGLVVALARPAPAILVEPRRKRAAFLEQCVSHLRLAGVRVEATKVERVQASTAVISARAVASIENLLRAAMHCATPATRWLLPRGTIDRDELSRTATAYRMMFHVEHSMTHDGSAIVILEAR